MNENQIKVITDSLVEASKLGTVNALTYIKTGLEAFKNLEIPRISEDGQTCYGYRRPYRENNTVQTFVDFMLVYLDEAIKQLDENDRGE